VDKSSPKLLESQVKGRVHKTASLEVYDGSKLVFTIRLKNVTVTSVSHTTQKGNPREEFALNFEEIKWTFHDNGKGKVETEWKKN
jgi:type VI secretion system Hcp family effector